MGLYLPHGVDSEQDARDFVEELVLTFSFATDRLGRIAEAYALEYYPKTYFINMDGDVVSTYISTLDAEEIIQRVVALIGDPAS